MDATLLCMTLEAAAAKVLRQDVKLMDNHHEAPGYILFQTQDPKKFISYLVWRRNENDPAPFCHAFELTSEMDRAAVKQAVESAQSAFLADVERFNRVAKQLVPIQGAASSVQYWPVDLSAFGKNPYGAQLYRVIYAPSRLYLVGGRWHDREAGKIIRTVDEYRWIPRYQDSEGWVLEKWLSPEEFAGSREAWDETKDPETGLYELGPYPAEGEFESCWTWPKPPSPSEVVRKIQEIRAGHERYTMAENKRAHLEAILGRKEARGKQLEDMVKDALPAQWGRAMSGSPYRSAQIDKFDKDAADVAAKLGHGPGDFRQIN